MLHAVKRRVARVSAPLRSAPNAEFADLRQRLSSIKSSLKYTHQMLSAANRHWIVQMQEQRRFSERFSESYPTTHDQIHRVALQFAAGSQTLYDKFTRDNSPEITAYQQISHQVLLYIQEIENVEANYSKLAMAKSETERYQSKLDFMERSKKQMDEAKKSRNLQKMDNERDAYKKLLVLTINAQKETYAKHPVVFKAALTAYWLSHEKHVTLLVKSLENTQAFAKEAEKEMIDLDITTWIPPPHSNNAAKCLEDKQSKAPQDGYEEEQFHSASTIPLEPSSEPLQVVTVESPKTDSPNHGTEQSLGTPQSVMVESPTNVIDTFAGKSSINRKDTGADLPTGEGTKVVI